MKITPNHPVSGPHSAAPLKPSKDPGFKTLLAQTLQKSSQESVPAESVVSTAPTSGEAISLHSASWEHAAVNRFENLLDALTTYQKRLGDSRFSLKNLGLDLNRIDSHCQQLDALTEKLATDSEALPFLKEGLATARIEIERFQRGDYC